MTKTGLANKELDMKRDIANKDRASREDIAKKDRRAKFASDAIKTAGKLLSPMATIVNDPKWYKRLPEMQDVIFNIPSYYPNGSSINAIPTDDGDMGTQLPMVKTLYYDHTFESNVPIGADDFSTLGYGTFENSPLNISAMRYKTELRKENSRVGEYESGDIFQVTAGEVGILEFILYVKRALLCMYTFNAYNPKLAKALVTAQGFDYDSLETHLKDLQKWINLKISEVNTFLTIPADMTYALRKLFLVTTVYKEGNGDNAQYVQFVPIKFPLYDENEATLYFEYPSKITVGLGIDNGLTYEAIVDIYNKMMAQFTNSSVLSTMIADIRGANIPFLKIGEYKYDEQLVLRPIDDVMLQIMNATICPWVGITTQGFRGRFASFMNTDEADKNPLGDFLNRYHSTSTSDVCLPDTKLAQDANGFLYFNSSFDQTGDPTFFHYAVKTGRIETSNIPSGITNSKLNDINKYMINCNALNFYNAGKITDDMIIEATRLHCKWKLSMDQVGSTTSKDNILHLIASTTEVIVAMATSYGPAAQSDNVYSLSSGYIGAQIYAYDITNVHAFNYHPLMLALGYWADGGGSTVIPQSTTVLSQWDKAIKFNIYDASPINDMCIRSLIYINPPKGFTK